MDFILLHIHVRKHIGLLLNFVFFLGRNRLERFVPLLFVFALQDRLELFWVRVFFLQAKSKALSFLEVRVQLLKLLFLLIMLVKHLPKLQIPVIFLGDGLAKHLPIP